VRYIFGPIKRHFRNDLRKFVIGFMEKAAWEQKSMFCLLIQHLPLFLASNAFPLTNFPFSDFWQVPAGSGNLPFEIF